MRKEHLVKGHVVYVYWIDTVYVQNNLPTEVSKRTRTSDGGNGNHSVSLPIILIKIHIYSYSYIFLYNLAVGLCFMILRLITDFNKCTPFWGLKWSLFVLDV